jgi:hypothetical protein
VPVVQGVQGDRVPRARARLGEPDRPRLRYTASLQSKWPLAVPVTLSKEGVRATHSSREGRDVDQVVALVAILLISALVFGPSVAHLGAVRGSRSSVETPGKVDQVAIGVLVVGCAVVFGFILVLASW